MASIIFRCRERQVAELALLAAMYPIEYQCPEALHMDTTGDGAKCSFHLQPSYTLKLSLPKEYPELAAPIAYLDCGEQVGTADRKTARAKLLELVEWVWNQQKSECLDVLVEEFRAWLEKFCMSTQLVNNTTDIKGASSSGVNSKEDGSVASSQPGESEVTTQCSMNGEQRIKRTLLWSHHLLATSKRKDIIAWSRELQLGGYSRPGYPGAIFVEGLSESVDEFVRRMKGLRWQALQVRMEAFGKARICGDGLDGISEVQSLSEVVEGLRSCDEELARLFLEGMKISH